MGRYWVRGRVRVRVRARVRVRFKVVLRNVVVVKRLTEVTQKSHDPEICVRVACFLRCCKTSFSIASYSSRKHTLEYVEIIVARIGYHTV